MVRTYRRLPSLPEPVVLDNWRFSIVRPIGRTNLVTNPSVETNTTGYTTVGGGGIARSTTYAYHGAYSLAVTPLGAATDGVYYTTTALTSGTTYAASVKFYAPTGAGKRYRMAFATTAGVTLAEYSFVATGRWQWLSVLWTETSTTTRRIYVTNAAAQTPVFYLDGLQVEACETGNYWPTTYIDGDQLGLLGALEIAPYLWTGTPHASTSIRSGQTRAGGQVVSLDRYSFQVTSAQGLGLAPVQQITTPFGQLDGAQFLDLRKTERPVTLAGRWGGWTPQQKERQIAALAADLDRDRIATRQPLTILAEPMDGCRPIRAPFVIPGLAYVSGLEGALDGLPSEESAISFVQYRPQIAAGDAGVALDVQDTLAEAAVLARSAAGVWSIPGSPYLQTGITWALARAINGTVYAGGDGNFTLSDASTLAAIAQLNSSTWSGLSTGMGTAAQVFVLAVGPDGTLYAGGGFTTAGGGAANYIAAWNGSAWSALGSGMNNIVRAITFGSDGTLYAAGDFTTAGGGAAVRVASWNGAAWSALGSGINNIVHALATGPDGRIYAGGDFTTAGGTSAVDVAVWDGSAWAALGSGSNNAVRTLTFGPNGVLYAGGDFTTMGGVTALKVAAWNGVQWTGLGEGITSASAVVYDLVVSPTTGLLYAAGDFLTADNHPATNFAVWNGASWSSGDFNTTNGAGSASVAVAPDGSLVMGVISLGAFTTEVAAQTTATVRGSAAAYPRLTITGPSAGTGTFLYLANTTTGAAIYADMLVFAGETVVIDFRPTALSVTSTTQGNRLSTILPGSNLTGFILQPGTNTIACLCDDSSMTAVLSWVNDLASLADGWTR